MIVSVWALLSHIPGTRPWRDYRAAVAFVDECYQVALTASPDFKPFPPLPRDPGACRVTVQSSQALMIALRAALAGAEAPEAVFAEHAPSADEVWNAW